MTIAFLALLIPLATGAAGSGRVIIPRVKALPAVTTAPALIRPGTRASVVPLSPLAPSALKAAPLSAPAELTPANSAAPLPAGALESRLADAARRFASGAAVPQSLQKDRIVALHELRDLSSRLAAEGGAALWDGVFLHPDGSATVFLVRDGRARALRSGLDGLTRTAELETPSAAALTEARARAAIPGQAVLLPISELANVVDQQPDRLFAQEGDAIFRLRHVTRGEFIRRSKTLLRRWDSLVRTRTGEPQMPRSFRSFLETLAAAAFPGDRPRERVERAVQARSWHDLGREYLRWEHSLPARVAADPRFGAWRAALETAFLPARGFSGLVAAEKLILAAAARRNGLNRWARFPALGAVLDEVAESLESVPSFAPLAAPSTEAIRLLAALASSEDWSPAKDVASTLEEADAVAAGVAKDLAATRGPFWTGMARLLELLRVLPPKAGPGADADKLDFVERFVRQAGVENAGRGRRYRYTVARVFSGTTYYPYSAPLPPIAAARPKGGDLRGALRRALSGNRRFEHFEAKFADERPLIKEFLLSSPEEFPELSAKLRKHVNPDHVLGMTLRSTDPGMINRFWPDYARWEAMAWDRVTFDFVRGVEEQLLRRTSPLRFLVRLVSDWAPEDFSRVSDEDLDWAVRETLRLGRHRAKKFDGVPYKWSELRLKQLKDPIKRLLLMNVPKTKYLRHRFAWDSYFGISWDCMCWGRESLFRVSFKK